MKLNLRTKEQKLSYRQVKRRHQKIFRKLAKHVIPTDYGFMMEFFIEYLKYMADYYKNGCAVGDDPEGIKPRLQTINMALQLYRHWYEECEDEYFTLVEPSEVEKYKAKGWVVPDTERNSAALNALDKTRMVNWVFMHRYPTFKETTDLFVKEYAKRRKEFFDYVAEHIEEWWD